VAIDLKQERPAFRVGLPLLNIHISEYWTKGCYRIRRTGLYLVVPTLVRLLLLGYLCYVFFGILDARYVKVGSFVGTCLFGMAAWVTHKKWFPGAPEPLEGIAETKVEIAGGNSHAEDGGGVFPGEVAEP